MSWGRASGIPSPAPEVAPRGGLDHCHPSAGSSHRGLASRLPSEALPQGRAGLQLVAVVPGVSDGTQRGAVRTVVTGHIAAYITSTKIK